MNDLIHFDALSLNSLSNEKLRERKREREGGKQEKENARQSRQNDLYSTGEV